jgi:uncharacterized ubiquitin-like protein YukD
VILVDIYIPALDKTYDFQVDENVSIESLILEISEMIGNETKSGKGICAERFMLCSMEQEQILKKTSSLQKYGIVNGSRLMLV